MPYETRDMGAGSTVPAISSDRSSTASRLRPSDVNKSCSGYDLGRFRQRLLSGFGVVIGGSCDQGSDEGAEQSLSPPPGVVDELKEAKVGGQLLL
jgi:hypothetical protein